MPLYPGTGAIGERGEFNTIVNAPLSAGDGGDAFREALRQSSSRVFENSNLIFSSFLQVSTPTPEILWQT